MVDHGRCREPSLCFATHTQGMPAEVRLAESLPPAAVSTAWRQTVGLDAGTDAPHNTNRLSDWDSRGAYMVSVPSSA